MKRLTTYLNLLLMAMSVTFLLTACEDEPEAPKPPLAFFTFDADPDNSQLITFTNETENGDSYVWDFGDSETSTETNPSHEYADGGTYTVKLTATNAGGDNSYSEDITVLKAAAENLIVNGTFDDETGWTLISFYKTDNTYGDLSIANGTLNWTENDATIWKHLAAYQELTLEAGTYTIDMNVEYDGIDQIWGEAFIGQTVPMAGTADADSDYNADADNDYLAINFWNGWDCGATYSGSAVSLGCKSSTGVIEISTAGTYYLVLKSGGLTYGANGAKMDDVVLYKQ